LTYARGRLAHFLLETALFLFVLIIFALRDNNIPITAWLPYAIFFVLITEFGGHFIDWYAANTIERVSRYSSHSLNKTADLSRKFFYGGGLLYASVPIGLIGGLIIGLIQNRSNQEVLLLCTQFVLVLASIIIAVLLGISSLRMARSMFTVDDTKSQNQLRVTVTDSISIFGVSGNVLKTIVSQANTSEEYEKRRLSLAQIVSDLRKIHLYDSSHNIILLVALSFAAAGIFGFNIELRWVIIILLLLHLLFAQLPYVIGQLLLQQEILRNSEGMERVELSEKLRKISPLFPTNDFFVTLTATGTAGGFLYIVIDEFIKAALT